MKILPILPKSPWKIEIEFPPQFSAPITFTSMSLQNLVICLFKILSVLIRDPVLILANCFYLFYMVFQSMCNAIVWIRRCLSTKRISYHSKMEAWAWRFWILKKSSKTLTRFFSLAVFCQRYTNADSKISQYLCLQMKIVYWRFHVKTPFTFWGMGAWDIWKVFYKHSETTECIKN